MARKPNTQNRAPLMCLSGQPALKVLGISLTIEITKQGGGRHYDKRGIGSALKGGLFLLAIVPGFEGPTHALERALPQAAQLALPHPPTPPV